MNVSFTASGTPSATKASLEAQVRARGDENPAARATLRAVQRHIESCIDDGAESVTLSGSVAFYVGNAMPEAPQPKEGAGAGS